MELLTTEGYRCAPAEDSLNDCPVIDPFNKSTVAFYRQLPWRIANF